MTGAVAPARRRRRIVAALVAAALLVGVLPDHATARDTATGLADDVTAAGAVLWDPLDGRVLWERAGDTPRRMASTTKIMTALLAIEDGALDDTVTVSGTAASADEEPGAATLALAAGEQLPMRSLLTGLLLRSGNDAAVAVAEHVAGGEAAFVDRMNARAAELGLDDTRFLDTSGLTDSPDHHASPVDLARLAHVAMADPAFAEIVGLEQIVDPELGPLENRNLLLGTYEGATGVKTGYTALAGLCLVASATRDGRTLYAVVLGSEDSFGDTSDMLDVGFDAFTVASAAGATASEYRTAAGAVDLELRGDARRTVPVDATVEVRTRLRPEPPGPVPAGARLGAVELVVDDDVVETAELVAATPLRPAAAPSDDVVAGRAIGDAVRAFARVPPQRRTPGRIVHDGGRP